MIFCIWTVLYFTWFSLITLNMLCVTQQPWWKWFNEDPTLYCDWSHNEDARSVGAGVGNSPWVDWAERACRGGRRLLREEEEEDGCWEEEEELSPADFWLHLRRVAHFTFTLYTKKPVSLTLISGQVLASTSFCLGISF